MKKTMTKELAILTRCTEHLESLISMDADDAFEKTADAIGSKVKGNLTFAKWKAACAAYFQ